MQCHACGLRLLPDARDPETGQYRCTSCGTDYDPNGPVQAPITLPSGFEWGDGQGLVLHWRRRNWARILAAPGGVIGLVGLGFMFYVHNTFFSDSGGMFGTFLPLLAVVFTIGSIGTIYSGLVAALNSSTLTIDGDHVLRIRHRPLPWFPQPTVEAKDIAQVFVHQRMVRRSGEHGTSTSIYYDVQAELKSGQRVRLVKGFQKSEPAHFIEQEIEKALGIEDRVVEGEYSRRVGRDDESRW